VGHINFGALGSVLGLWLGTAAAVALLLYAGDGEAWPAIGGGLSVGLVFLPIASVFFAALSHPIATIEWMIEFMQWARILTPR
jgi:hypothetical protein